MNDQKTTDQNEQVLSELLDGYDKDFVSSVGVTALGMLTEYMDAADYKRFVDEAVDNAHELHKQNLRTPAAKPGKGT